MKKIYIDGEKTSVFSPKVVNNLTDGGTAKALSAEQGKTLKGLIDNMQAGSLDGLTDTDISNKAGGDVLQYDSTSSKWKNKPTTFTEASTRANIDSGDSISTIFGKIKKFFSDLKAVAFSGAYSDLTGQPTNVSSFNNDAGYVTTDHTYNFSGTNFHSGNGSSEEHNCNNMTENGLYYYQSNGPSSLGEQSTDGAVMVMAHSASWLTQLAQDYRTGKIYVRSRKNGAWQSWIRVDYSDGMRYTGTANTCFTVYQGDGSFMGRSGWASYLISNHGDGATYYSQTIALPFWGPPIYRRLEGGSDKGWMAFITQENIGTQSVNYANSAGAVTQTYTVPLTIENKWYRLLYSGTADNTTRTEGTRKGGIEFNPLARTLGFVNTNGYLLNCQTNKSLIMMVDSDYNHGLCHRAVNGDDNQWGLMPYKDGWLGLGHGSYRWGQIYSTNAAISTSDRNEKKDISPLDDKAKDFIMALNPVSYKFIDGKTGRTHYGMIAQDVEEVMSSLGMTDMDFAGFCKDQKMEENYIENEDGTKTPDFKYIDEYRYGLRYEEFIGPIIKTEQLQQEDINSLKEEVALLKEEIALLKQRLQILEEK